MVYMVMDLLKERSDDSFYTEEHVLFLLSKIRSYLLERKYRNTRNGTFNEMPEENKQMICLDLEPTDMIPGGCSSPWLKTTKKIPETVGNTGIFLSTVNNLLMSNVTYIPAERMPYVGYNKWLRNIIYASKSSNDYLYLFSRNPQFIHLEKLQMEATFADPEAAAALSCEDSEGDACDIMDKEFPLEETLIVPCIELTVQELSGSRYAPEDRSNNAQDEFGVGNVAPPRTTTPVDRDARRNEDKE